MIKRKEPNQIVTKVLNKRREEERNKKNFKSHRRQ